MVDVGEAENVHHIHCDRRLPLDATEPGGEEELCMVDNLMAAEGEEEEKPVLAAASEMAVDVSPVAGGGE